MKRNTLWTCFLSLSLISGACFAVDPVAGASTRTGDAVTTQDREAVQRSVQALGTAFGVEAEKSPKVTQQQQSTQSMVTEKTVADVLDKAVDKVSDVVGAMAKAIQGVAPDIWRIMLKQQYAKAVSDLIVPVVLNLTLFFLVVRKVKALKIQAYENAKSLKQIEVEKRNGVTEMVKLVDDSGEPVVFIGENTSSYGDLTAIHGVSLFALGLSMLWLGNRLADTAKYLVNPEFYAIQDLLKMILTRTVQ